MSILLWLRLLCGFYINMVYLLVVVVLLIDVFGFGISLLIRRCSASISVRRCVIWFGVRM